MDAQKIMEQAILHKHMPIEPIYAKRWINEAMDKLSTLYDSACIEDESIIDALNINTRYPLPDGVKGVKEAFIGNASQIYFMADPTHIKFKHTGSYRVVYLRMPNLVQVMTDTPEINSAYHFPIAKYVAAMEMKKINLQRSQELEQEFYYDVKEVDKRLKRIKRKNIIIPKMPWR